MIKMQMPKINAVFTMLEPKTFPSETPTSSGFTIAYKDTLSSGREVAKPTKTKPMVVFPNPVISEILTEFLMVNSLPTTRKTIEARSMIALPISPSSSSV